jgi:hypothetical protein
MSYTNIDLCSRALVELGANSISSFDETSCEATVASQLYQPTLENLLASYPWRFALKQKSLARLENKPVSDYQYAFQLPNNCLRILSAGQSVKSSGLQYKIVGKCLYANTSKVILNYIEKPDESTFPPFFVKAFITQLASEFCLPLTESTTRTDYMRKIAAEELKQARLVDSQQSINPCFQDFSLIEVRA